MQYIQPFTYFASKKPNGLMNLLFGSICVLIPVVGPIVLLGYRAEIAEDLDRDPELRDYPDFDFNRFVEYLTRGIWPFLMQLIVSAGVMVLVVLVAAIGFVAAYAVKEPLIGVAVGGVLLIPVIFLSILVLWPLELHTQLSGKFEFGQAFAFMTRFVKRVWGQALLAALGLWFLGTVVILLGYAALCIGAYPAMVIVGMAEQHFIGQLYRLYLDEGGVPIAGSLEQLEIDEE
ncbi:MAG TPA: DUF4013 domain-containing protein [Fimbriiglobus sp.]|nr:DUF4013 domain-containing protein [Fimbriiglobus sp.]